MDGMLVLPLRHHRDVANSSLEHPRIAARSRRRLLSASFPSLVAERLSGDIMSHGYFSADVTVGCVPTPALSTAHALV